MKNKTICAEFLCVKYTNVSKRKPETQLKFSYIVNNQSTNLKKYNFTILIHYSGYPIRFGPF